MTIDQALVDATRRWIDADPDAHTRAELRDILDSAIAADDSTELEDRMSARLVFGTAGLRGQMGAGRNRMNRLVVRQTAAGLATVINERTLTTKTVLIGHDARHHSARFAHDICEVLGTRGIGCVLVHGPTPTPLVAWGMRHVSATAGVVVTASHNPPQDNGIKIYWSDGAQIIPPVDSWISDAIDEAVMLGEPRLVDVVAPAEPVGLDQRYVEFVAGLVPPADDSRSALRIAVTSMHGVGANLLSRCLAEAGFTDLHPVKEQERPDPDFPTVAFPNPEEPGATDLLIALATRIGATIAFANDPDADRLAVCVPSPTGWRMLSGDEVGALFAAGLMQDREVERTNLQDQSNGLLVTTVVSSQLLGRIAAAHDVHFEETLTGFKWLCRPALADPTLDQLLAYEEALGYAIGGLRDKDGISAAVLMAHYVARWHADGRTPQAVLDDLALQHGAHVQHNFSGRVDGPGWKERLDGIAQRVVSAPPTDVAGHAIARIDQPAADVIRMFLDNGDRIVLRPSGTEPKMKCYCEAVEPVSNSESPDLARARAKSRLDALHTALNGYLTGQ